MKSGTKLVHIPYACSPQAVTALIRGDVQMVCLPAISVVSQVAAPASQDAGGDVAKRSPLLPDLPTLKEGGIDVEANAWNGLIAPGEDAAAMVAAIAREVNEALRDPGSAQKLHAQIHGADRHLAGRVQGVRRCRDAALDAGGEGRGDQDQLGRLSIMPVIAGLRAPGDQHLAR